LSFLFLHFLDRQKFLSVEDEKETPKRGSSQRLESTKEQVNLLLKENLEIIKILVTIIKNTQKNMKRK